MTVRGAGDDAAAVRMADKNNRPLDPGENGRDIISIALDASERIGGPYDRIAVFFQLPHDTVPAVRFCERTMDEYDSRLLTGESRPSKGQSTRCQAREYMRVAGM